MGWVGYDSIGRMVSRVGGASSSWSFSGPGYSGLVVAGLMGL